MAADERNLEDILQRNPSLSREQFQARDSEALDMQNLYCLLDFTEDVLHPTSVEIWESTWTMLQVPNPLRPKTSLPKESPGTQKQRRDKI